MAKIKENSKLIQEKVLFLGYGDIAERSAQLFLQQVPQQDCSVTGIARGDRNVIEGVDYWRGAIMDRSISSKLRDNQFRTAIITLTPGGRGEAAYRAAYIDNVQHLVELWQNSSCAPALILFISSTSVYGQNQGEWVDENSITEPESANSRCIVEAEQILLNSSLNTTIIRFSGIYGPGRNHLLHQVYKGKGGRQQPPAYSNRIHADDCAGVIYHLWQLFNSGHKLDPIYLASDCDPVASWDIRQWLAGQMGFTPKHLQADNAIPIRGNKRCCNKKLLHSGYQFLYPSYKEGYMALVNDFLDSGHG